MRLHRLQQRASKAVGAITKLQRAGVVLEADANAAPRRCAERRLPQGACTFSKQALRRERNLSCSCSMLSSRIQGWCLCLQIATFLARNACAPCAAQLLLTQRAESLSVDIEARVQERGDPSAGLLLWTAWR